MAIQNQKINVVTFFILTITLAAYLMQPIWDMDFWWHIASGRWMVEARAIPNSDPFGVFLNFDPIRLNTLLHAEWLGQVLLFLCYDSLGLNGIIAMRVIIILLCLSLVFKRANQLRTIEFITLMYIGLAGIILLGFTGSRPQLFSFLFASLTFALLDAYHHSGRRIYLFILPFISVLWSNCHGGGILGAVLVIMFCGLKAIETLVKEKALDRSSTILLITGILFFVGSLVTPNGIVTYQYLVKLEGSQLQQVTSEYISSLRLYTMGLMLKQLWVGLLLTTTLGGIIGLFREHKTEMLVTIFLGVISVMYYRYLPFLILVGGPYVCLGLSKIFYNSKSSRFIINTHVESALTLSLAFVALSLLITGTIQDRTFRGGINQNKFPVNAVEYIKKNNITGKAFNHFKWGGYLIWYLYPRVKIYIDGRMLDGNKLPPYTHILWATPQGIDIFKKQQFDLVILPRQTYYSGEVYKLHKYLNSRKSWNLIYIDKANGHLVYQRVKQMDS